MLFGPKDLFEKEETEVINEGRVYTPIGGQKPLFILYATQERGRNACGMQSYFKFKPGQEFNPRTGVARISFRGAGYIHHPSSPDGPKYELNKEEYRVLNKILLKPNKKYPDISNWVALIKEFNREQGASMYENTYSYYANNVPSNLAFVPLD